MAILGTIDKVFTNKNDWMAGTFIPDSVVDVPDEVARSNKYKNNAFKFSGKHLLGAGDLTNTRVRLSGQWENGHTFGWSFNCEMIDIEMPNDVYFFLVKFISGIGPSLASHMVKRFGNDKLIEIIENRPNELKMIKGIGPVLFNRIMDSWNRFSKVRKLSDILAPAGCSATLIYKVFRHFENTEGFIELIKDNYYILVDVPGLGFKTVDQIALKQGVDPLCAQRIGAAIVYCVELYANTYGNTYCDIWDVNKFLKQQLDIFIPSESLNKVMQVLFDGNKLVSLGDDYIMLRSLYKAESCIYKFIERRHSSQSTPLLPDNLLKSFIEGLEVQQGFEYAEEQRQAIISANTQLFYVIAGSAGTGKTTVAHGILKLLSQKYDESSFCVTALSGIATDRIKKTTGYHGATIQSLLVTHKNIDYLAYDVLIIDEASMIPSEQMAQLLKKVSDTTVVILIGDQAQLDPVGPGSPFADIIRYSKTPKTVLTKPNRTSSASIINKVANDIRVGQFPHDINDGKEFVMIDRAIKNYPQLVRTKPEKEVAAARNKMYETIKSTFTDHFKLLAPKMVSDISKENYYDFLFDHQLISPQKIGPLGSRAFNKAIKAAVNKSPSFINGADGNDISLGDKVVHITNIDMPFMSLSDFKKTPIEFNSKNQTRVFNGFIGIVLDVDKEQELAWVYYPLDEKVIIYEFNDVKAYLELAYALTIHKTQGSEFNNVYIPINLVFYRMLNTRLVYTAVTRAKTRCVIVGDRYALKVAVDRLDESNRFTYLQLLLKGEL